MQIPEKVLSQFHELFPSRENLCLVRSPGRINLIGEHTDYNEGFVLPAAIDKAIFMAIAPRSDQQVTIASLDYQQEVIFSIENLQKNDKPWSHYLMGVVEQFQRAGKVISGFDCVFAGEIPLGAGLSSSAALECATAFALNDICQLNFSKLELVQLAQKAENEFVGVKCGIMDQFASMFGKKNQVLRLDCRTLAYEYFPLSMEDFRIVLCDSGVKHSLADSAYNIRRQECETGVAIIRQEYPQVFIQSLRDVNIQMLINCKPMMPEVVFKRCLYVLKETERLLQGTEDLKEKNLSAFGQKMFQTHEGLRDDYEVSCEELDILVAISRNEPNVLGSRMMGGGFGGCTINLVKEKGVENFMQNIEKEYFSKTGISPKIYTVTLENGTEKLSF
ncbi:MAG: galactokinase [Verrucomicrobia bacterium]|nr:galactokinase [Cytophagales bacterium]